MGEGGTSSIYTQMFINGSDTASGILMMQFSKNVFGKFHNNKVVNMMALNLSICNILISYLYKFNSIYINIPDLVHKWVVKLANAGKSFGIEMFFHGGSSWTSPPPSFLGALLHKRC